MRELIGTVVARAEMIWMVFQAALKQPQTNDMKSEGLEVEKGFICCTYIGPLCWGKSKNLGHMPTLLVTLACHINFSLSFKLNICKSFLALAHTVLLLQPSTQSRLGATVPRRPTNQSVSVPIKVPACIRRLEQKRNLSLLFWP